MQTGVESAFRDPFVPRSLVISDRSRSHRRASRKVDFDGHTHPILWTHRIQVHVTLSQSIFLSRHSVGPSRSAVSSGGIVCAQRAVDAICCADDKYEACRQFDNRRRHDRACHPDPKETRHTAKLGGAIDDCDGLRDGVPRFFHPPSQQLISLAESGPLRRSPNGGRVSVA